MDPVLLQAPVKTDQTVLKVKLIRGFAGHTGHFVGFVVMRLILSYYVKTISLLADNKYDYN